MDRVKILEKKLREKLNIDDYVFCNIKSLDSEEEIDVILKFIEENPDCRPDDITLRIVLLEAARKEGSIYDSDMYSLKDNVEYR